MSRNANRRQIARQRAQKLRRMEYLAPEIVDYLRRAYTGRDLRSAVIAHCLECMRAHQGLVTLCSVYECPFWEYRLEGAAGKAAGTTTRRKSK